jgi:hypothetical protein
VEVVESSVDAEEGGFCIATVALACDWKEVAALSRLAERYDPRLDVFDVRRAGNRRETHGPGNLVELRVQVTLRDAQSLESLLRRRLCELSPVRRT